MNNQFSRGGLVRADRGVSLPEVLVALVILSMALVGILSFLPLSTRLIGMQRRYTVLVNGARDAAETLLSSNWNDPDLDVGLHRVENLSPQVDVVWRVRSVYLDAMSPPSIATDDPAGNLKVITITAVDRSPSDGARRTVTVVVLKGW